VIRLNGREFRSKTFGRPRWSQTSEIKIHGRSIGELEVGYLEERPPCDEGPFLKEERSLIDAIARLLTRVIERREAEEAIERSEERLTLMNRIANIFLTVPDDRTYEEAIKVYAEATGSERSVFGYVTEDKTLVFPSIDKQFFDACRVPGKTIVFPREKWGGVWGRAVIEKKSICKNGPHNLPQGHVPIRRSLSVPVIHLGEAVGVITLVNKETDYDEEDQELVEELAAYMAPVVHARLQRDKREEERQQAYEELNRQKREAEEARARAQIYFDFLAHDIANMLSPLGIYADQILKDEKNLMSEETRAYGAKISTQAYRAASFIHNLRMLEAAQRIPPSEAYDTDLRDVLSGIDRAVQDAFPGRRITVTFDIPPTGEILVKDGRILQRVLQGILDNSARYAVSDEVIIEVRVVPFEEGEQSYWQIEIADNGPGISDELKDHLSKPLDPMKRLGTRAASSMLFYSAIVGHFGGRLWIEDRVPGDYTKGAKVIMRLRRGTYLT